MNGETPQILVPFFGLMLTTMLVWVYMYYRRLTWIAANKPGYEKLATPEKLNHLIPEKVNAASNNLKNLFELPVLFYAVCLFLVWSGRDDQIYVLCAYGFWMLRTIHSLIHCTVNVVPLRFTFYLLSAICLWVMVIRAALGLIQ